MATRKTSRGQRTRRIKKNPIEMPHYAQGLLSNVHKELDLANSRLDRLTEDMRRENSLRLMYTHVVGACEALTRALNVTLIAGDLAGSDDALQDACGAAFERYSSLNARMVRLRDIVYRLTADAERRLVEWRPTELVEYDF